MDYTSKASVMPNAPRPVPELGRLKAVAERIDHAARGVENFVERFTGPLACEADGSGGASSGCYRDDIAAIFRALEVLEQRVIALDSIG